MTGVQPDVTVIIPYCAEDEALARAIASVQKALAAAPELTAQLLPVDDTKRSGVSAARNRGLSQAQGRWIVFVDADDTLHERFFSDFFVPLSEAPDTDLIACGYEMTVPAGAEEPEAAGGAASAVTEKPEAAGSAASAGTGEPGQAGNSALAGRKTGEPVVMNGMTYIEHRILCRDTHVWAKAFRRQALEGLTFDEDLTIGEDMLFLLDFALRSGKKRCIRVTDMPGYHYTLNPAGAMERAYDDSFLDEIRCWQIAQERVAPVVRGLSPYSLSLLGTIRIRAALLVALKAARTGTDEESIRRAYAAAAEEVRTAARIPGASAGLSIKERLKMLLFEVSPRKFSQLAKKV